MKSRVETLLFGIRLLTAEFDWSNGVNLENEIPGENNIIWHPFTDSRIGPEYWSKGVLEYLYFWDFSQRFSRSSAPPR